MRREHESFNTAFLTWLGTAHPDVFDQIGPPPGRNPAYATPGYYSEDPDHMLIALDYVDEFIAQSDDYPLEPGGE